MFLNIKWNWQERFLPLRWMTTLLGNDLVRICTTKQLSNEIWNLVFMKFIFDFIKQNHRKLVNVHLFKDSHHGSVTRCSDGSSEELRINCRTLWVHKIEEEIFEFYDELWRVLLYCWDFNLALLSIFHRIHIENSRPELLNHVELLEQTVKIADTTWVF